MKRVVPDTNVLLSGTYWTGPSFKVLELADSGKIKIVTSPQIIQEYQNVAGRAEILEKTTENQRTAARAATRKLLIRADIVEPTQKIYAVKDDPEDNKIIEAAVTGKAEYIITQDNHLLSLKHYANIKITTPQNFLKTHNNE